MNITEFLLARITEDEKLAHDAIEDDGGSDEGFSGQYDALTKPPSGIGYAQGGFGAAAARMIATYAVPARVLAECAAKRAIIQEHSPVDYSGIGMKSPNACNLCGVEKTMFDWEWDENSFPCNTLRALAAIYAGHPDYQEAWAINEGEK